MLGLFRRLLAWFGMGGVMCAVIQGSRMPDVQTQVLDKPSTAASRTIVRICCRGQAPAGLPEVPRTL